MIIFQMPEILFAYTLRVQWKKFEIFFFIISIGTYLGPSWSWFVWLLFFFFFFNICPYCHLFFFPPQLSSYTQTWFEKNRVKRLHIHTIDPVYSYINTRRVKGNELTLNWGKVYYFLILFHVYRWVQATIRDILARGRWQGTRRVLENIFTPWYIVLHLSPVRTTKNFESPKTSDTSTFKRAKTWTWRTT